MSFSEYGNINMNLKNIIQHKTLFLQENIDM